MTMAMSDVMKFTSWKSNFSMGKMIFLTRIFLNSYSESMMEYMAESAASMAKANSVLPRMR